MSFTMEGKQRRHNTPRMDELTDTVREYGSKLFLLNMQLSKAKERKAMLQDRLQRERSRTTSLRSQLEVLNGKKRELAERERCRASYVNELSQRVDAARTEAKERMKEEAHLRSLIEQTICETEDESCRVLTSMQGLKLKEPRDQSDDAEEELAIIAETEELQKEIEILQREKAILDEKEMNRLPVDTLKMILKENTEKVAAMTDHRLALKEQKAKLERDLQQLKDKKEALQRELGFNN